MLKEKLIDAVGIACFFCKHTFGKIVQQEFSSTFFLSCQTRIGCAVWVQSHSEGCDFHATATARILIFRYDGKSSSDSPAIPFQNGCAPENSICLQILADEGIND